MRLPPCTVYSKRTSSEVLCEINLEDHSGSVTTFMFLLKKILFLDISNKLIFVTKMNNYAGDMHETDERHETKDKYKELPFHVITCATK